MVPMAPSMMRMRLSAAACSAANVGFLCIAYSLPCRASFGRLAQHARVRAKPKQVADGVHKVSAVEGVEMELLHAFINEVHGLLGGHGRGNEMAGRRIVFKAVEAAGEPGGDAGAGTLGKGRYLLVVVNRDDAGGDRHPDASGAGPLQEAQVMGVVEAELGDDAVGAGIDLGFEVLQ